VKNLLGASVVVASILASSSAMSAAFTNLYVFGDSLVDAGNTRILTAGGSSNPAVGYFNGRNTNGPDYVDYLNQRFFGTYTTASLQGGNNFAYGGALARNNGDFIPDLQAQVGSYFSRSSGVADPNALYVINVGGNDLFGLIATPSLAATFAQDTIGVITAQIRALNAAGARNILVTGLPNVGGPPAISSQGVAAATAARALSVQFNTLFNQTLNNLSLEAGTTLFRFDYIAFFDAVVANPTAYGLPANINLTTPCLAAVPVSPTPNCTPYAFFDAIHPEARVQFAAYQQIERTLGIPEPATIGLAALGFVGLGVARRRKRRTA
jgi:phospholipase/lecithinase/hemolysin